MMLAELDRDIAELGYHKAAYPTRYFAAKPFIATLLQRARNRGHWAVIEEHDAHFYVTVYDIKRVARTRVVNEPLGDRLRSL